ncbi:HK97 family phage prohead protease [Qipengyuania sp.]|uniref:HK97 family phage prohead protease n=1 Tax=Qipengyuania sp. TaxID=2004515 RepID=UPI003515A5DF
MPAPKPKSDGRELRTLTEGLELRFAQSDDEERVAEGYAAVFGIESDIGGYFTEVIAPGAFAKSLDERDCLAVHSHDLGRVVGRKNAGTLELEEDGKGLHFRNDLPDTSDGRDLAVQIDRGDIAGMSFAFRAVHDEWDETVDPPKRTIHEAILYEITYTPMPQYPDTEVGMRSLEHARQEKRTHNRSAAMARIAMRQAQAERKPRSR